MPRDSEGAPADFGLDMPQPGRWCKGDTHPRPDPPGNVDREVRRPEPGRLCGAVAGEHSTACMLAGTREAEPHASSMPRWRAKGARSVGLHTGLSYTNTSASPHYGDELEALRVSAIADHVGDLRHSHLHREIGHHSATIKGNPFDSAHGVSSGHASSGKQPQGLRVANVDPSLVARVLTELSPHFSQMRRAKKPASSSSMFEVGWSFQAAERKQVMEEGKPLS